MGGRGKHSNPREGKADRVGAGKLVVFTTRVHSAPVHDEHASPPTGSNSASKELFAKPFQKHSKVEETNWNLLPWPAQEGAALLLL